MGTGRLKRQKIMLPINSEGQPDYAFMEAYMRDLEHRKIEEYKTFISKKMQIWRRDISC